MSRSPFFFIERYNRHTEKYELQHPLIWNYEHTERVPADLYPYNGSHDLFSIVEGKNDDFPVMRGIHYDFPKDVSEEIKSIYNDIYTDDNDVNKDADFVFPPVKIRWFTYADMYIYCLENSKALDYDAMDEKALYTKEGETIEDIYMDTPMKKLKDRVDAFLMVSNPWNDWEDDFSLIRIVYWID